MNYQDTVEQADEKLQKSLGFLKQYRLPANPINYGVIYEYFGGSNVALCQQIDRDLKSGKTIDCYLMENLYKEHVLQQDANAGVLLKNVTTIMSATQKHAQKAQKDTSNYITLLDEGLLLLDKSDPITSKQVVEKLLKVTSSMKGSQQILVKALRQAQAKTAELQKQVDELESNRQLDQLTGLFNRAAMNQTFDLWLQGDINKIAAIAINLDHFKQFNDSYGVTIGNVILSKVAQKVKSYVEDTGLPVRTGGEEFLILLPDADLKSAQEVAEKVRSGVERLQFINAKNREKLPKVTVSLGVTEYKEKLGLEGTIQKASAALRMAKATGRNRVFAD